MGKERQPGLPDKRNLSGGRHQGQHIKGMRKFIFNQERNTFFGRVYFKGSDLLKLLVFLNTS